MIIANESLDKNEKLFHDCFEIAPEGITILDIISGTFVKCNRNASELLKLSPEEILTKGPAWVSPEFQPDGSRSVEKARELVIRALKGEKIVFEWLTMKGNGELFMAEVRLVPLPNSHNTQLYASFLDITERVEVKKKINDQNRKLSEIAFMQSHNIRQPVANILGLISLFNFDNINDPINVELLLKLKTATKVFDSILKDIVSKAA